MAADDIHTLAPAYALDALEPDEERRFEAHLAGCEQCRADVDAYRESAAALASGVDPVDPPDALRDRILEEARADRPNVVPLRPRRFGGAVAIAYGIAAVAASAAIGLGLWAASLKSDLDAQRDAAPRVVELTGADGAVVVTNSGRAALVVTGLPPAPPGKTYEVWVIEKTPKPAGLMGGGGNASTVRLLHPAPGGSIVAVTVERAGGVDAPTGKPLFSAKV
jgi:anti-sigma-K factor RskA